MGRERESNAVIRLVNIKESSRTRKLKKNFKKTPYTLQLRPSSYHGLPPGQPRHGIVHHLVHNRLRALLLRNHGRRFPHQEWAPVVHGLIVDIVAQSLKIVLDRDDALAGQVFDLLRSVFLPVFDIGVVEHAEGTALHWVLAETEQV